MYQVLYRKWRPLRFSDISGQEHITRILKQQVISDRLAHAYLFTGTRGTGKTSCAKILARAVNCENPVSGDPCGICDACTGIDNASIMDVTEMDAASNNGVDHVRALREEAVYLPASAKKRVYIVDEVHMLTIAAFNALLKILEEPPPHLLFILATTELHKVPVTILSRCQKFAFHRLPHQTICDRLTFIADTENISLEPDACSLIARLADGSMRDALSILDQCSAALNIDTEQVLNCVGLSENDEILKLFDDIIGGDAAQALSVLDKLYRNGKDPVSVLAQLCSLYRDILLTALTQKGGSNLLSGAYDNNTLTAYSDTVSKDKLISGMDMIQTARTEIDRRADRKMAAELCLIRLCGFEALPVEAAPESRSTKVVRVNKEPELKVKNAEPIAIKDSESSEIPDWKTVLAELSGVLDAFIYGIVADTSHCEAKIGKGEVLVYAKSPFSLSLIDTPDVTEALKTVMTKLSGTAYRIRVSQEDASKPDLGAKLENLSRFGNVKFE